MASGIYSAFPLTPERWRRIRRTNTRGKNKFPRRRPPLVLPNVPAPRLPVLMSEPAARPPPRRQKPPLLHASTPRRRSVPESSCWPQPEEGHTRNFTEPHVSVPKYKLLVVKLKLIAYYFLTWSRNQKITTSRVTTQKPITSFLRTSPAVGPATPVPPSTSNTAPQPTPPEAHPTPDPAAETQVEFQ
jgi:hypothetical protein